MTQCDVMLKTVIVAEYRTAEP